MFDSCALRRKKSLPIEGLFHWLSMNN